MDRKTYDDSLTDKKYVKQLPCIVIPSPNTFKIVETDASDIGYGGILKQVVKNDNREQIVRFHSGSWSYPTEL